MTHQNQTSRADLNTRFSLAIGNAYGLAEDLRDTFSRGLELVARARHVRAEAARLRRASASSDAPDQ